MVANRKAIPVVQPPVQTPRSIHLEMYGEGPRPCLDGAHHWIGCGSNIDSPQMCVYMPALPCTFARPTSKTRSVAFVEESLQQTQAVEDRQALRNWSHSF